VGGGEGVSLTIRWGGEKKKGDSAKKDHGRGNLPLETGEKAEGIFFFPSGRKRKKGDGEEKKSFSHRGGEGGEGAPYSISGRGEVIAMKKVSYERGKSFLL